MFKLNKLHKILFTIVVLLGISLIFVKLYKNNEARKQAEKLAQENSQNSPQNIDALCPLNGHGGGEFSCGGGGKNQKKDEVKTDIASTISDEKSFINAMVPHQQEAIDAGNEMLNIIKNEEIKKFINHMIQTSQKDINNLQKWHQDWFGEEIKNINHSPIIRPISMKNTEQKNLKNWLQDMIYHHQSSVDMVNKILAVAGIREQTETVAKNILQNQTAEMEQMNAWLSKME